MASTILAPIHQLQLAPGSSVKIADLNWSGYQALLTDFGDHRAVRLTYSEGVLEIRMPSKQHELINRLIERIITTLTEELDLSVVSLGSTTLDREALDRGVEPDSCFYIQNAAQVNPEETLLPANLPPDLIVEVDITSSSQSRLAIYHAMGVPEVWRYQKGLYILQLRENDYVECKKSSAFPNLSASFLNSLIQAGQQSRNQNLIIRDLRDWLRNLQKDA
ncbi:MAG: Uma2 family endonuclease [Thermosynechococcaceae cyanobacterium]